MLRRDDGSRERGAAGEPRGRWRLLVAILGPGLLVMLADSDAGSIVTAAQSGAEWGLRLVVWQLVLIPVLYVVQEMTVRLGCITGEGHGELIRRHFGRSWALLAGGTLFLACLGALVTEFAGLSGAAALAGVPRFVSVPAAVAGIAFLCAAGRYRRVELVGITFGLLELVFLPAALLAHPHLGGSGLAHPVVASQSYLFILAANVGAVIMPWMIFYHQQAVAERRLTRAELPLARVDTAVGAVLTQVVMIAVLVACAVTIGHAHPGTSLSTIGQISAALVPFLGPHTAPLLFGLGMAGAATAAALVVTLAGAWGLSEVLGWRHSLNDRLGEAKGFYALGGLAMAGAGAAVVVAPDLVSLSVDVQVMNAALLPVVLGFLLLLERRALPPDDRMAGWRAVAVWAVAGLVSLLGVTAAASALFAH